MFYVIGIMMTVPSTWDIQANEEEILPSIYWNQCLCSAIIQHEYQATHTCIPSWLQQDCMYFKAGLTSSISLWPCTFLFLCLHVRSKGAIIFLFYRVHSNSGRRKSFFTNHPEFNCGIERNLFFPYFLDHNRGFSFHLESFPRPLFPSFHQLFCPYKAISSSVFWLPFSSIP